MPERKRTVKARSRSAPRSPERWACPKRLEGEAKAAWDHVVKLLAEAGNLDRTDPTLVECYAVNVALLHSAHETLSIDGPTSFTGSGAITKHPAIGIINSASMRLKSIIFDLGLCPASSKHASSNATEASKSSKWDGVLGVTG